MTLFTGRSCNFPNGLAHVRTCKEPRPLVIFHGLMFEKKPQSGMTFGYKFLGKEYPLYLVLGKPGLPQGYILKNTCILPGKFQTCELRHPQFFCRPPIYLYDGAETVPTAIHSIAARAI